MNAMMRRAVIGTAAVSMALSVAACGSAGGGKKADSAASGASGGGSKTIGLLLPENSSSIRYESFDKPIFTAKVKALCPDCEVKYNNAQGNTATQKQQFDALVSQGVKVIVLDPQDATATKSWVESAKAKGVQVIAYDRFAAGPVAGYVSFDNEKIGELQGQALVDALGDKAKDANVVMINGAETDPNAGLFKQGAHKVLDSKVKKVVYEQSGEWDPKTAGQKMGAAITQLGKNGFQAVYSANDGMAAAIITSLKGAGIKGLPVGGQDAASDAIQRVLAGDQTYTIYKAYKPEAEAAAQMAVNLVKGEDVKSVATASADSDTAKGVPAILLDAKVVTKDNVKDTVIADQLYKVSDICTGAYVKACDAAGIK
ncbi:substrate-binding domain-containing protein [Streptacidiphilus sp. ASG 303]|uniref:sugar ABC transporter substrate-binding protein n=1 Tax=Streptacidiphilus sp. ASG 303 TaxID=2896847 RepID=UPI001E590520|nr:substrate-binding domain-containing protein [Streptacidiphilus sp. ASG 303]MCD0486250.1 substrate-binding domain-containing protein [Streptacidiphilus sp. ASG 303]